MLRKPCFDPLRIGVIAAVASLLAAGLAAAQEDVTSPVTITAPQQAVVGQEIEVRWQGELGNKGDFVSVDEATATDRQYGNYFYARKEQPGTLRMPDTPGSYLVRYHAGTSGYAVRGQVPIEVIDATATIDGPLIVDAGGTLDVAWTGPAHRGDFISIDPAGSKDRAYGPYAYTKKNPAVIRVPEAPGTYEVRYHLGQTYRVIATAELTVSGVTATLEAPDQVPAGGKVSVGWEGPNARGDYISIDPADAPDRAYLHYGYTKTGNPVTIQVPEEAGTYEIRYHQGQQRTVIARVPLEVVANQATIAGPPSVAGGSEFQVEWTGPANPADYVTIVPAGSPARHYLDYTYTRHGSPSTLEAPLEPGAYELRYLTGLTRGILAQTPIEVTPGAVPGTLRVVADTTQGSGETAAVEVILDASGSMLKRLANEQRFDIAKDALENLVTNVIPPGTPFALRVFGHKESDSCRTDLEIPVAALDGKAVSATIQSIQAMNLAKTPIAASLDKVKDDLAGISGPVTVVLLTDGEETCEGDPRAAIEALRQAGFDVRVNIVGFAINELALKEQFEAWARVGNGRYIEAHDRDELHDAINRSLDVPFEVLQGDDVVATGVVNGETVALLPATYQVRLLGSRPRDLGEVTIEARTETDLRADGAE